MLIYEILENKLFFEISETSKDFILEIIINVDNQTINNKINRLNFNQNLKNLLKKLLKPDKRQRLCTKLIKQTFLRRITSTELNGYNISNINHNNLGPKNVESKILCLK